MTAARVLEVQGEQGPVRPSEVSITQVARFAWPDLDY
jgi:hypothetical protein